MKLAFRELEKLPLRTLLLFSGGLFMALGFGAMLFSLFSEIIKVEIYPVLYTGIVMLFSGIFLLAFVFLWSGSSFKELQSFTENFQSKTSPLSPFLQQIAAERIALAEGLAAQAAQTKSKEEVPSNLKAH